MALALRLLLLLLLAVALPARAAQAAPLQAWRADLDHNLHDLEVLVNDTLNVLENAGAEPAGEGGAASQLTSRTEPLGDGEGVSAERTSPAPLLIPTKKPGSHCRGPPRGKNKATGHQKPHEPSENMRQMLKEMQQAGEEVDGEAGQKATFPGGSSGSMPASAAGREAMPGTGPGAEVAQKASPSAWLHKVLKPLESPADVSAGRTFPVPLLIPTKKAGSHGRGPLRGKNKGNRQKKPHEPNNILKQIVTELHKGHGMDREALWKMAFPEGREEMPGTVPGDWDHGLDYLETLVNGGLKTLPDVGANPVGESDLASQPTFRIEPLGHAEVMDQKAGLKEVFPQGSSGSLAAPAAGRKAMPDTGTGTADAAGTTTRVLNPQKGLQKGFYMGTGCWAGLMAGLLCLTFICILCCVQIHYYWKRKCRAAAAPASQPRRCDSPWPPGSPESFEFCNYQTWPLQQQQLPKKADYQPSVPPPRPPIPAVKQKSPEIPPPPPLPSPLPWSS